MPDPANLAKAKLLELDANFKDKKPGGKETIVQFNPDSLKVSFANQIATPDGAGDKNGPQAQQFVGAGTTKLTAQLMFDVTSKIPIGAGLDQLQNANDVRKLTELVAYFITPVGDPKNGNPPKKFIPPAVRFQWGSFQFDGIMESMEETLELFSFEGRPLRASVAITLSQQKITAFQFNDVPGPPPVTPQTGTQPLTEAPANSSVQSLAANQSGVGPTGDWQSIAAANNIDNPRLLQPGQLINLNPPSVNVQLG